MKCIYFFLLILLIQPCRMLFAQQKPPERIKIFLNCTGEDCHEEYLINDLSFFDFVRDRFQADVQVLLVEQTAASSGSLFTLYFIGQKQFDGIRDSTTVTTKPADTDVIIRERLLEAIKTGLANYALRTDWKTALRVDYTARPPEERIVPNDPWNSWVFTVGLDGDFNGESKRSSLTANGYLSAYRITPKSKIMADIDYEYTVNKFQLANQNIRVWVDNYSGLFYYTRSLNAHWSAGGFVEFEHDKFQNIRLQHRVAPALEYNFYNFSENTKRQLRLGYQAGYRHLSYLETTIFDRNREFRPYHQLALVANYAQPWGSVRAVVQGRSFLDNVAQNRFTTRLNLSLRLFEGFNLNVEGSFSLVNDQISLARRVASEEEILLRGTQLPTRLLYEWRIGCTYTFGSTNNSIVNPRFEDIDN